jgi:RES domain
LNTEADKNTMIAMVFDSSNAYSHFSDYVMRSYRYLLDDQSTKFIRTVVQTSEKRKVPIPEGTVFWRAQLGCDVRGTFEWKRVPSSWEERIEPPLKPYGKPRMRPLSGRAVEGRINPKGMPCLYLSSDRDTAVAETRPWIGSYVSVAQFRTMKPLVVVDCSSEPEPEYDLELLLMDEEPEPGEREQLVWNSIIGHFLSQILEAMIPRSMSQHKS